MTIRPDINIPEAVVTDSTIAFHSIYARGYNDALAEVAHLNPADPASTCQSECGCDKEGPTNPDAPRPNGGMPIPTEADWRQRVSTLSAEVERLTLARDNWKALADSHFEQAARLTAERDFLHERFRYEHGRAADEDAPDLLARAVMAEEHSAHERDRAMRLAAEVERLTADASHYKTELEAHRQAVERLTAERDRLRAGQKLMADACDCGGPDPDAPPIPCVEVEATDGRRTWRAMGDDVRTLGDEWERCLPGGEWGRIVGPNVNALGESVYLIRRTEPAKPRTERVPLAECLGRWVDVPVNGPLTASRQSKIVGVDTGSKQYRPSGGDWKRADSGTVEVLVKDT